MKWNVTNFIHMQEFSYILSTCVFDMFMCRQGNILGRYAAICWHSPIRTQTDNTRLNSCMEMVYDLRSGHSSRRGLESNRWESFMELQKATVTHVCMGFVLQWILTYPECSLMQNIHLSRMFTRIFTYPECSLIQNIHLSRMFTYQFGNQFTFLTIKGLAYSEIQLYWWSACERMCPDKWGSNVTMYV